MVAPLVFLAVGAAVSALSGLVGYLVAEGKEAEARRIQELAEAEHNNLDMPRLDEITAEVLGPTELAKIKTDPAFRQAQMDALDSFKEMVDNGGFTMEDKANLNRSMNETNRGNTIRQNQIYNEMRRRGAGGGAEYALRMQAAQEATNRQNQTGLDVAAMGQNRAFQAVGARAGLAGQMESNDWNRQAATASAQDAINRFNLGNRQDVAQYNNGVRQQNYGNQLNRANIRLGFAANEAEHLRGQGRRLGGVIAGTGQQIGGAISGIGGGGIQPKTQNSFASFDSYYDEDENPKKKEAP